MFNSLKEHLKHSKVTFFEHFKFAVYAAALLFWAALASVIHAFIPSLCKGTAAFIVIKLYNERLVNHPNPQYASWIENVNNNKKNSS